MAKGIGQSGAWAISIIVSLMLFAGIIALVLSIEEGRGSKDTMELLTAEEDEQDIISTEETKEEAPPETKPKKSKKEPVDEDGEYEIKADDASLGLPDKKKVAFGPTAERRGLVTGRV